MTLQEEAEKYARTEWDLTSIDFRYETHIKVCSKDFIAGATSKYVEKQKLEYAIEQLKNVDFAMCKLLRSEAINFDLSQEEATYKWERTKWHLEIIDKIKELEQKLNEL